MSLGRNIQIYRTCILLNVTINGFLLCNKKKKNMSQVTCTHHDNITSLLPYKQKISFIFSVFTRPEYEPRWCINVAKDIVMMLLQLSIVFIWPITITFDTNNAKMADMWPISVSLILISIYWWENFVDRNTQLGAFGDYLRHMKRQLATSTSKTSVVTSLWKILVSFLLMIAWLIVFQGYTISQIFDLSLSHKYCSQIDEGGYELSMEGKIIL